MKKIALLIFVMILLCIGVDIHAALYEGVEFPEGEISFADTVVSYQKGSWAGQGYDNPLHALGLPTAEPLASEAVSLGNYGSLILGFTDNYLLTSGNNDLDLWIFESGPGGEQTDVSISQDGTSWTYVGRVAGAGGIDIDATVSGGSYSFVKLYDVGNLPSTQAWAGSDIDAVGAITTVAPEPISSILFVTGGTLLAGGRRYLRRKKKA